MRSSSSLRPCSKDWPELVTAYLSRKRRSSISRAPIRSAPNLVVVIRSLRQSRTRRKIRRLMKRKK